MVNIDEMHIKTTQSALSCLKWLYYSVLLAVFTCFLRPSLASEEMRVAPEAAHRESIGQELSKCNQSLLLELEVQHLRQVLSPIGLTAELLGCPMSVKDKVSLVAWRLVVLDGEKAMHVVRGALADGEPVDMGEMRQQDLNGALGKVDGDISPDVLFNRQWFARLMRAQGYETWNGVWWLFQSAKKAKPQRY